MQKLPKWLYTYIEFGCHVCINKSKEKRPHIKNCAWRGIDNEYCPMMKTIIDKALKKHENYTESAHPSKVGGRGVV